jgi:CBS domain-containing protein
MMARRKPRLPEKTGNTIAGKDRPMSVGRICQRDVDLADLDESAWAAAERMHQRSVGSLIVLNENRQPIGIVTDRDLVINVLAHEKEPRTTRVREIMTAPIKTIGEDAGIESALSLMRSGEFRRMPVVDRAGRLVGVLSLDDVLTLLAEEFTEIGHLLDRQTPRAAAESATRTP